MKINSFAVVFISTFLMTSFSIAQSVIERPNVILIITDDQGHGDLSCHGNQVLKTPHLDEMYKKSIRLTDFHVSPTCSPTRAALMTGRYNNKTGVWHTVGGCSFLRKKEITLANVFSRSGYETGMFGKWHLGDVYPARPQDKGFKYVVAHGGGGVGQTPDYWNNDYFDDTYFVNGEPKQFNGYCTNVWFDEAIRFMDRNKTNPFFCYISTNAPHSPYNVPEEYYNLYKEEEISKRQKMFYGMISNFDDNMGKLQLYLSQSGLSENTIVIFLTDNGTAEGLSEYNGEIKGFNSGMKGQKNSEYEGGHRVPFFIQLPNKYRTQPRDIDQLTAHIDVLPTLAQACNLPYSDLNIDGISLWNLIMAKSNDLDREYIVTDSQRNQEPIKWQKSAVMHKKWRLVNGIELYNLENDPGQTKDLAGTNKEMVDKLKAFYDVWWEESLPSFVDYPRMGVGSEVQPTVVLTCMEAHAATEDISWHQNFIRAGTVNHGKSELSLRFERAGKYLIEISRWPFEIDLQEESAFIDEVPGTHFYSKLVGGKKHNFTSAHVKIGGWKVNKSVQGSENIATFEGYFDKGERDIQAWFETVDGTDIGAFYIRISFKDP